jgi:hypothetical protein
MDSFTLSPSFLEMALNESSGIRRQDGQSILKEIALNPVGTNLVFHLLNDKWDFIQQ